MSMRRVSILSVLLLLMVACSKTGTARYQLVKDSQEKDLQNLLKQPGVSGLLRNGTPTRDELRRVILSDRLAYGDVYLYDQDEKWVVVMVLDHKRFGRVASGIDELGGLVDVTSIIPDLDTLPLVVKCPR